MADYDLDEYEDYEDEGGEYEEEGGEYEEEEDRAPTQEELEYLELRQKLKESIRRKMKKKDPSSGLTNSREKKKKMPYDNFGSFFGPSQPVIAQRVIQESKSLLENPRLAETALKAKNVQNRGGSSTQTISKPRPNGQQPRRVDNYARPQAKIQMIKNTRDYSFLADGAELPPPPKNPPKSAPAPRPRPDGHSSQRQQPTNIGRKVVNGRQEKNGREERSVREERNGREERYGREERKPVLMSSQMRPKPGQQSQRPSTSSRPTSTSSDPRKQVGRNEGSGPGRPSGQKPLPSKMSTVPASRNISMGHKPLPSRPTPAVQNRPLEQKRKPVMPSRPLPSRPQIKQQPARPPPSSAQQRERVQKRPARPFADEDDDVNAISMIRNMFGYNPNKYRGVNDDDLSDMEAGFDDIMMEEKRSSKIAAMEDEEERIKIEEEERRERMRKEAKKRKLSHR